MMSPSTLILISIAALAVAIAQILMPFFVIGISSRIGSVINHQIDMLREIEKIYTVLKEIRTFQENTIKHTKSDSHSSQATAPAKIALSGWNTGSNIVSRGNLGSMHLGSIPMATLNDGRVRLLTEDGVFEFSSIDAAEDFLAH